ncbi:MAG: LysR family transcriptional regulator [Burkholderiales bacterium]|nr:LysR family transcriptional regulator [Burkholderiales bacterium]
MDLERLRLFAQVAELGSLSKAASVTGVPQSAISRKITALEQECSGRLFHRTGRGVALTELGARVFPRVKALLDDAATLSNELKASAGVPAGHVRIGVMPSLAHPTIEILLRQVRAAYPAVQLSVVEGSGGQLDEWLANGRVDFAILFRYSVSAPAGEEELALVETYLAGKPGNPLTRGATVDFARLDGVPLILPGAPNGLRAALGRVAQQERIALSVVMEADSLPIQKNIAATGDAFAVLGSHAVRAEVEAGLLEASCIVNPRIQRIIVLSTTSAHPTTLASREVTAMTRRIFQDLTTSGALGVESLQSQRTAAMAPPD